MIPEILLAGTIGSVIGFATKSYFGSYLGEKGKNLATKEDIEALTKLVEGVRLQHQRAGNVSQAQFEAELQTYKDVWSCLILVQRAAISLRPVLDYTLREGETEEQRKQERLQKFADAYNKFIDVFRVTRPFYPEEVYKELLRLEELVHFEAIDYQIGTPNSDFSYWKQAKENSEAISKQCEKICTVIRERLARLSTVS